MTSQLKNILTFILGFYFAGFFVNAASAQSSAAAELLKNKELSRRSGSTMDNPYELIENWPTLLPGQEWGAAIGCLLYTSPSPRDATLSRMPSSA